MRSILIFAVLAIVGVLAWHASMVVAPRIERDIDGRVEATLGRGAVHPLGITTHGRVVRLSGLADSEPTRAGIVRQATAVPGVGSVVDDLSVLPAQVPYRFAAKREADQPLRIDGAAPSAAAETLILDRARAIATGHTLQSALILASGAPGDGWADSVGRGLVALGALAEGAIEITGRQAHLGGRAASEQVRAAIVAQLAADPLIDWEIAVTLITPRADPYRFRAETAADGARFSGHAPDEVVRARLTEAARTLASGTAQGEITLADGMPGRDWPRLVERGLGALALLETGSFEVAGIAARLAGTAATPEAAAAAARRAGGGIALDVTVANPMPAARLEIEIADPQVGPRLITARLPGGLDRAALARALPELDLTGAVIATGGRGQAEDWEGAVAALAVALPRLAKGRIAVEDRRLAIDGRLRAGFSSAAARDALRQAAGPPWQLVLALDEAPLPAGITLRHGADGTVMEGILPDGIAPEAALLRLGGAAGTGLASGGAGDPVGWRRVLDALAAMRLSFETFQARVTDGRVEIAGTLAPGASAAALADSLAGRIGAGWAIDMAASAAPEAAPPAPGPADPAPLPADTTTGASGGWMVSGATPEPAPEPAPEATPEAAPGPAPDVQATAIAPSGEAAANTAPAMADAARRRAPMPPRRPTPNP